MKLPIETLIRNSYRGEGWHRKNDEWYATIWAYKKLFRSDLDNNDDINFLEAEELIQLKIDFIPDVPFNFSSRYEKGNAYRYYDLIDFYQSKN